VSPRGKARDRLRHQLFASLASGLLFGAGLVLAGMTQPSKVIAFLDFTGDWDPSLALVMVGAIGVHAIAYRVATRRSSPLFAERFALPTRRDIDGKLLLGAALFGIGWGIGGFCPGPGLVALAGLGTEAAVFVAAMMAGMFAVAQVEKLRARSESPRASADGLATGRPTASR
jgi:uncharacterized membrane protein YedE/YeeE